MTTTHKPPIEPIEQLTDEDRAQVRADEYEGQTLTPKLVRIIDADAADRAALVSELDERRKVDLENCKRIDALVAQLEAAERKIRRALELCEPYAGRLAPIVAALRGEEP